MNKYKVTQEFMEVLNKWKEDYKNQDDIVDMSNFALERLPIIVDEWRFDGVDRRDKNERFGAIINWINGEGVFEIGIPIYVVRLKGVFPGYIRIETNGYVNVTYYIQAATRFDDFEKASEWANAHFEVVEVDE